VTGSGLHVQVLLPPGDPFFFPHLLGRIHVGVNTLASFFFFPISNFFFSFPFYFPCFSKPTCYFLGGGVRIHLLPISPIVFFCWPPFHFKIPPLMDHEFGNFSLQSFPFPLLFPAQGFFRDPVTSSPPFSPNEKP